MKIVCSAFLMFLLCELTWASEQIVSVSSPDKRTEVKIALGERITYSLFYDGNILIAPSPVSLELYDGKVIGANPNLIKQKTVTVDNIVRPLYGKNAVIKESYTELNLTFRDNYSVTFRAYNEGIAYRFTTFFKDSLTVKNEEATFVFPQNCKGYYRKGKKDNYLYEAVYENAELSKIDSGRVAIVPCWFRYPMDPK